MKENPYKEPEKSSTLWISLFIGAAILGAIVGRIYLPNGGKPSIDESIKYGCGGLIGVFTAMNCYFVSRIFGQAK